MPCSGIKLDITLTNPQGFKWQSDKIKVLGIHIGNVALSHIIWNEKIDKFTRTSNLWKMRDLSLTGKRTVINILAAGCVPLVPYLRISHTRLGNQLNDALWTFLWGNKMDPVKRDIAMLPFDMGGGGGGRVPDRGPREKVPSY